MPCAAFVTIVLAALALVAGVVKYPTDLRFCDVADLSDDRGFVIGQVVPMTQEKMNPLRARMIEDMRIRGLCEALQRAHIRALKDFTAFLGRSPHTATPEELRAYQLHMSDTEVTPSVYNARITALRFFFGMACDREDMKKYM